jgi:uncharacterized NAD-dependent epimerase/dehydratase family protein
MNKDGVALVYCEGAFDTTYGKSAHGLVRFTRRYEVAAVMDSHLAGQDAGAFLDGVDKNIPLVASLDEALEAGISRGTPLSHFVVGIATDGGYLDQGVIDAAREALEAGLNVDSGLHEFISDIPELRELAKARGLVIRDIRKAPDGKMHPFTGRIEEVTSRRVAVLGTDSALGKRTTAWILVHALEKVGHLSQLIGTGQTAWMQGVGYGLIMDSLLNDFVSGELENAAWTAWHEENPDFLIIEGQGSLMNPGYPGGFEILAACRPQGIILQHAPARKEYDGFPGYPIDPLKDQIHVVEFLSKKPVIAITINHEDIPRERLDELCGQVEEETGITTVDPLIHGVERILPLILALAMPTLKPRRRNAEAPPTGAGGAQK